MLKLLPRNSPDGILALIKEGCSAEEAMGAIALNSEVAFIGLVRNVRPQWRSVKWSCRISVRKDSSSSADDVFDYFGENETALGAIRRAITFWKARKPDAAFAEFASAPEQKPAVIDPGPPTEISNIEDPRS